jgi:flagellar M-ring protein FliF
VPATVSSAELAKLSAVVSAGLGLDPTRGDKIDIAAVAVRDVAASPVAPSHATAATSAADSSDDADATATEGHAAAAFMPPGIWPYVGLAALLVLLVAGVLIGATRSRPRRLLASEREGTLAQLRQWIESTETEVER